MTENNQPTYSPMLQIGLYLFSMLTAWLSGLPEMFKAAYIFLAPIVQLTSIISFVLASILTVKNIAKKDEKST